MWHGVYLMVIFLLLGVVPVNLMVKGLQKAGFSYWPRVIVGVIYLLVITELIGRYLNQ